MSEIVKTWKRSWLIYKLCWNTLNYIPGKDAKESIEPDTAVVNIVRIRRKGMG